MIEVRERLAAEVDFDIIRYSQCWEDADVVLEALQIQPGDVCLSIASAGDNSLSLLTRSPSKVFAIDLSASQLACLELRIAAYRHLTHAELLELVGARPSARRAALYRRLAPDLSAQARVIWDDNETAWKLGIGAVGKFERYLDLIRRFVVGPTHSRRVRENLFLPRTRQERKNYFEESWNSWFWRALIRFACSGFVMGRLGRDPRFFKYAEGSVSDHIQTMVEHAMVDLDPADNPYLQWIILGRYRSRLPHALREENFNGIRARLDRLELQQIGLQSFLENSSTSTIGRFNLSDVFEYISVEETEATFEALADCGAPGARIAYWNMLVPRHRPENLCGRVRSLPELSSRLRREARTFFYTDFVVEEVV